MFWRVGAYSQASTIETLLDRDDYTLEELLDEDDLIQECKSLNGRLINFLQQPENVLKLVGYLIEEPAPDADAAQKSKYPYSSCEVFCCEVDAIFTTMLESEEIMRKFFSILDGVGPVDCSPSCTEPCTAVDCTAAGYFGRVMSHLLLRKPGQMLQYLQRHVDIISNLIQHIYDTSICEVVLRLVCPDDHNSMSMSGSQINWLCETPLLDCLLEMLSYSANNDTQVNAAQALVAIIRTQPSALSIKLSQFDYLDTLVSQVKRCEEGIVSIPLLNVCIAAMDPRRRMADGFGMLIGPIGVQGDEIAPNVFAPLIGKLVDAVPALLSFLKGDELRTVQLMPYGVLEPPVGLARLKITEMFSVLMCSGWEDAQQALINSGAIDMCLDLFLQYPFNNLLHRNVAILVAAAVGSGSPEVLEHLFTHGKLLDWLISVPDEVTYIRPKKETGLVSPPADRSKNSKRENGITQETLKGDDNGDSLADTTKESVDACCSDTADGEAKACTSGLRELSVGSGEDSPEQNHKDDDSPDFLIHELTLDSILADHRVGMEQCLRAGYIGHVTQMANHVILIGERDDWVKDVLQNHPGWVTFVNSVLAERNDNEEVGKWTCGRPIPGVNRVESPHGDGMGPVVSVNIVGDNRRYNAEDDDDLPNGAFARVENLSVPMDGSGSVVPKLNPHETRHEWEEELSSSSSSSSSSSESSGSSASGGASDSDEGSPKLGDEAVRAANGTGSLQLQSMPAEGSEKGFSGFDASCHPKEDGTPNKLTSGNENAEQSEEPNLSNETRDVLGSACGSSPKDELSMDAQWGFANSMGISKSDLPVKEEYDTFSFWRMGTGAFQIPDDI